MILEPGTVKGHIFDAFFQSAFCNSFTYSCGGVFVTGVLQLFRDSFFYSRSGHQNFRTVRCDYLGVNMTRGTMYHQASRAKLLELATCAGRTTDTSRFLIHSVTLLLLSLFGTHDFVGVTNTLAFVRLRTTVGAQISCNLTDHLLISAFQHDFSLSRAFCSDASRQLMFNGMRETQRQVYYIPFDRCTITYTNQLQFLGEAFGNTDYCGVQQRTSSTCLCPAVCITITRTKGQVIVSIFNFYSVVDSTSQLAIFTFDRDNLTVDFYINTGRNDDRCFSNTRHSFLRLGYVADNFATKTSLARCTISHNTFRGRNNSDTQSSHNFRQFVFALINAQTRTANTLNAFYH
ncbi:Uncharacterised protein [Shimwellia blattae]|nr:Uncharacterised protein [Shimwellia blattae]VEC19882.1 Uncharacterised protein [Shimwellia blattae]